jgi:hypothetical protein
MLNRKGQMLLETCADSRVSNAITQLSTKYQALLSLAKEVVRRLEVHFQEHISTMHFVRNFKHGLTKQESNSPLSKLLRTHMKILKINLILSK